LQEFLPYRLSVVTERMSKIFAQRYEREFGISISEWRVMAVLGEGAQLSTQQVIEATQMDRVRVSRAVIRLSDKGLLTRKAQEGDKRAQILRLSRTGLAAYRRVIPLARMLQADLAARLEPEELQALDRILAKLHVGAGELLAPPDA
jgi:DNA-binding MarR family transcriptional regulator